MSLDRFFDYEIPVELREKLVVGQLLSVPFGHRAVSAFLIELTENSDVEVSRLKPVAAIVDETPFFSSVLLTLIRKLAAYTLSPIESVLKAAIPAAVLNRNVRPRECLYVDAVIPLPNVELTERQRWLYDQLVRLDGGWLSSLVTELKTTNATFKTLVEKGVATISNRERRRNPLKGKNILPSRPLSLNTEQKQALAVILNSTKPVLLFGVTGSGKTEVYLQAIAVELAAGRGAIVMVPEIALTPQTVQRFVSRFGDSIAVLHSALSDGERFDEWHRIRSGKARVVIGPRSAVFAPVTNLGMIIVDEEHEPSYKQDDTPRYNARDAAVLRGALEGARVVLGSATPSLESWHNVELGKYHCATMSKRAGAGKMPQVTFVDMSEPVFDKSGAIGAGRIFSQEMIDALHRCLQRGEQSILFLNRRGFSRSVVCQDCGAVLECERCNLPYTYHRADSCLRCHICGSWLAVPKTCPKCHSEHINFVGIGTQRVEAALHKFFPKASVLRMDADSVSRRHSHDDLLGAFCRGEAEILLGTQMIAKGLDFPNVTLVGVLNADSSLSMPDFRAGERTFQLISQVAGRAGRAELPGEVIIQTYDPQSPVLDFAATGRYAEFAAMELQERQEAFLPPFCHLALISLRSTDSAAVEAEAHACAEILARIARLEAGEAIPSALEKADGFFRWQITLRSALVSVISGAWKHLSTVRPNTRNVARTIDIDAHNLL